MSNSFDLARELDKTKSQVFMKKNAAFLGPLLCSLEIIWDETIQTAATDGVSIWWNPVWFQSLTPAARVTVLVHEVWHPAGLHFLRQGSKDPKTWNHAADHWINLNLEAEGYSFKDLEWACKNPDYKGLAEEEIYELLVQSGKPPPTSFDSDMKEPSPEIVQQALANVVKAVHSAVAAGAAGSVPGHVKETLNKFLSPVIPWEQTLMRFFTDMLDEEYTWARPNRRYPDMYLPSKYLDDGRLEHLIYYLDVSGSCSNADVLRFNSEVKFIKERLNPEKLTLVQFDTRIQQERVFEQDDPFDEVVIVGRGGTSLVCVREHMQEHRPTAAIIFSDLKCSPMHPLDFEVPVIWVAIRAAGRSVPFGQLIHIRN